MDSDHLRASDADRQKVAERLRAAMDEGRLTLGEYDERLGRAYQAQTYADLKSLLTDLPEPAGAERSKLAPLGLPDPKALKKRHDRRREIAGMWRGWAGLSVMLTGIWVLTNVIDGFSDGLGTFWPVWPIGIIGFICLARTAANLGRDDD